MKVSALIWLLFYLQIAISEGFILDGVPTSQGTTVATDAQDKCSIDVFENCTSAFTSFVNVTGGEVTYDTEGLFNLSCGPNYWKRLQCLQDHVDPACGPDTFAATINRTLASSSTDLLYDKICSNSTAYQDLFECQTLLQYIQGYFDCITGETLNKMLDPSDTCNFSTSALGCSYKYMDLMCPDSTGGYFKDITNTGSCNASYGNSQEARSCDDDMQEACSVAYKPPSFSNSTATEIKDFVCSKRSRGFQLCLRKVFDMCKDKYGFNISSISGDILLYESQTAMLCSDNKESKGLIMCQEKSARLSSFQDCITGKTLNTTIDPTDSCTLLQNSVGCSYKYTDLMCPEYLDALNKTLNIPPTCQQNIDMSQVVTACDNNTERACSVAFNPPVTSDPDVYADFLCSGRAKGYVTCLQKVHAMCENTKVDVSEVLQNVQDAINLSDVVCADIPGFKAFIKCFTKYMASPEYIKCASSTGQNITCSISECNLDSIKRSCPSSTAFYKTVYYDTLVQCNIIQATNSGTFVVPAIVSSCRILEFSMLTIAVTFLNVLIWIF